MSLLKGINVKVDLSNYATKSDLKNLAYVDVSSCALKSNLARLKLVSCYFCQIFIFSPNDSPSKTMKNVYFI